MGAVVHPVEDAVGAPARAVAIVERGHQSFADAVRVGQEGSVDELVRGERDGLGELFGELPSRSRRDRQPIGLLGAHAVVRRRRIASASSSAVSTRPAATSASARAS